MQRQMYDRRNLVLSEETRRLIDEAVAAGNVTEHVQPGVAGGAPLSRLSRASIAKQRREFRKLNK